MEKKYPHWYMDDDKYDDCCPDGMKEMKEMNEMCCEHPMGMMKKHTYDCCGDSLRDRLQYFMGDEVLVSVDAGISHRDCTSAFCGRLCYIGCDFIIVDIVIRGRPAPLHIPLKMIRFISPFECEKCWVYGR